ncbi:hypothetical protein JNB88_18075 [Rhizobium cauense]|uniref:hypothetical protein n=1 Tax=Rhizobium cauense TaxID=1166683 RepID=UPI001C6E7396|nr:hypothetical protein [Rhizobium cauense]MBW9115548.1 hypothetical protein [Rhizobium cauense]
MLDTNDRSQQRASSAKKAISKFDWQFHSGTSHGDFLFLAWEEITMSSSDFEAFKAPSPKVESVGRKFSKASALNQQQKDLISAYRQGKLDEEAFQLFLRRDPDLAAWVRQVLEAASHDPLTS